MGETLSRGNDHTQRVADAGNCPRLTGNAAQRAVRADKDAADFAMLIREEPPEVVWGRVARWAEQYPQRFQAAFVHLAAMVDIDQRPAVWTRDIGGTSALHPDYRGTQVVATIRPNDRTPKLAAQIVELAATSRLSDIQIATRFAVPVSYVVDVRRAARVLRASGKPGDAERDARIAALRQQGAEINVIADEVGVNRRTVLRSLARSQGRARNRRDAAAA